MFLALTLALLGGSNSGQTLVSNPACGIQFVGGDLQGPLATGSMLPSLSESGRWMTYVTLGFPNQVILHDLHTGQKSLVSSLSDGTPIGNSASGGGISPDGRSATFLSTGAVAGALGSQVFAKDLVTGALEIVSVLPDGTPMTPTGSLPRLGKNAMSRGGRFVAFVTSSAELVPGKTTFWSDAFVRDRFQGTTKRLLGTGGVEPNSPVMDEPAISANGRFVAFIGRASNLVPGDTNGRDDVFVHDLLTDTIERVSVNVIGVQANHNSEDVMISANGRYVVFISRASNLVSGDTNGVRDVFVHDRATGQIQRANLGPGGVEADGSSTGPAQISTSGQYVVFHSIASNFGLGMVGGRVYVRDLWAGTTEMVEPSSSFGQNNFVAVSANARVIAFASLTPFGPADTNNNLDLFVRRCDLGW